MKARSGPRRTAAAPAPAAAARRLASAPLRDSAPAGSQLPARPSLQLSLQWPDARHRELLPRHRVARCIRAALETDAQITVRVVGADEGQRLNREFRGRDYATNVLTFDYERAPVVMADLVLCAPVLEAEALARRIDISAHYAHLLVHGTLHAQGYDHERLREARVMERRESGILRGLGLPDPYA